MGRKRNEYVNDYVLFDLETTGISPAYDEVIEISAIRVENRKVTGEFSSLVNPGRKIPAQASMVNHITDDMVADAPFFRSVLEDFWNFAGNMILVGHNIHTFDMKFLIRDTEKYFGRCPGNDYVDTLSLARTYLPQLSHHRLVDLAEYYGISQEGAHRALNDCRMNRQVYELLAREMTPQKLKEAGVKLCPRCNSAMKKRNGRYGEFWGCTSYPACNYTENV